MADVINRRTRRAFKARFAVGNFVNMERFVRVQVFHGGDYEECSLLGYIVNSSSYFTGNILRLR
jgi:hypothetical protein